MPAPQLSLQASAHTDVSLGRFTNGGLIHVPLVVKNTSSVTETITAKSVQITSLARHEPALSWLRSKTPARFVLAPGQTRTVIATFRIPAGQTGKHALNLEWSASDGHAKVSQAITAGGTIEFHQPGPNMTATAAKPYAAPNHPTAPAGSSLPLDAGLGLAVVVLGAVAAVTVRRIRNLRTARSAS